MAFNADIVVTEPGSSRVLLIIEAKTNLVVVQSEPQLKRYMRKMDCPVGLLVSPEVIAVYRNWFTDYTDDSVQKVGVYPAPQSWKTYAGQNTADAFEAVIHRWLEKMKRNLDAPEGPQRTREVLSEFVLPSLIEGRIHAAGPRLAA